MTSSEIASSTDASANVCARPIGAADVSRPTTVVGRGAGTCTEQLFADAVQRGGVITFNCGGRATIRLTSQKVLPNDRDTVIDGGGLITLDGGGLTRLLYFDGGDFLATRTTVTLQRLTLVNGRSSGTSIPPAPAPCSQGYELDGGGAAVFIRDGQLRVIDCTFSGNNAASPGPDVGGGGIYTMGSLDTTITNSIFQGNSGSNGGAVGALFSKLTLVNNVFSGNHATGTGENYINYDCPPHSDIGIQQAGSGGNGGAISIDGSENYAVTMCGNRFTSNTAGGAGGAVFRTPDNDYQTMRIDRSTFDGNTAQGGGALYIHHSNLEITNTTISNNTAVVGGGIKADDTYLNFTNVTLARNHAALGIGGAIYLQGNGGTLLNCTIADNRADGGPGYFGAAIAGETPLTFTNTIFSQNTGQDPYNSMACTNTNTGGGNLQWPQNRVAGGWPDDPCVVQVRFANPMLTALADHGGWTRTMGISAPASIIQVGTNCPATDQTGRPRRAPCTLGALER